MGFENYLKSTQSNKFREIIYMKELLGAYLEVKVELFFQGLNNYHEGRHLK